MKLSYKAALRMIQLTDRKANFIAIAALLGIILYRTLGSLLGPGYSFSTPNGDGLGTIGWIFSMKEFIQDFGWRAFLENDLFQNPYFGAGLNPPALFFLPWKLVYGFLSQFMAPDQVYDLIITIGLSLTAVSAYWVSRLLELRPLYSFLASLLIVSMEHIDSRIVGHIGLSFWFAQLLQFGVLISWLKNYSSFWAGALTLTTVLSVASNEYFAFYGGLFCAVYGISVLWLKKRDAKLPVFRILTQIFLCSIFLYFSFRAIFPSMFTDLYHAVSLKPNSSDYDLYSYRAPGSTFVPSFIPELNLFPGKWHGIKGEMTLRLGLMYWCLFFATLRSYFKTPLLSRAHRTTILFSLTAAGLFLLFCALPTSSPPWISLLFSKTFPMFRSIVRAMLFFNVAMIFIGVICFQEVVDHFRTYITFKTKHLFSVIVILWLLLFDMAPFKRGLGPYKLYKLPEPEASEVVLSGQSKGLVLELPIENREKELGLDSFMMYRFKMHKQPIFNWIATSIPSLYEGSYRHLAELSANESEDFYGIIRPLGVHYLLVENTFSAHFRPPNFIQLAKGEHRTAFALFNPIKTNLDERRNKLQALIK